MRISACLVFSFFLAPPLVAAEPASKDGPVRVACLGDSITFGSGVEEREKNAYPAVLGRLLGDKYEVRNFGVGGATAQKQGDKPYWTLDAFKEASAFDPHFVVIKLGTNDSKPHNWHGAQPYEADLQALVEHFQHLPQKPRVFLCTPVPVYKDAFTIREAVVRGEVVPAVRKVAERTQTPVIDLYAALQDAGEAFPDGVHPNAAGAKKIAEAVAEAIRNDRADAGESSGASR
jgi:lysophospholipase L1-like esterase